MHRFTFTAEQLETLRTQRLYHADPTMRVRYEMVYLKSQGTRHEAIAQIVGVSRSTVQRRLAEFRLGDLEALAPKPRKGPVSQLEPYRGLLKDHFLSYPVATVAQAQAEILRLTGLKRGLSQVRHFLKKLSA